ncbi:flavin reductase [Bacteriovorax sp. BSW11_IV]|uniref:NADPH-dependent FMN reductase n=1 Tax=Bacteriovorax sp. BSW11_IV TaxID=1353529 RepID=UPI00038A16E4|nr:NADPH-dependent FMN reductase [Bacteriovorax sp. BSW11_IV]EQC44502.1 flavin reductase [Bacteriovorax sp. BSW11_IV]
MGHKRIIALNGSLRVGSSNGQFLNALEDFFSPFEFIIYPSLGDLPHFTPDGHFPEVVLQFKELVSRADYIVIVTPEYAHGVPGVLKNALDWLVSDERMPGKEVFLFVCSAGDGFHAMESLKEVLRTMSLVVKEERCLSVSSIRSQFIEGRLKNESLIDKISSMASSLIY